jgi:cytochrome b
MARVDAASDTSGRVSVKVWDAPTRCFHWTVVGLVALSWITAENGLIRWHLWSGALLMTLLLFRLAWGFVGSTSARFSHFVTGPRPTIGYLKSLLRGPRKVSYLGHNPAGGWMVVLLILVLILQAVTGVFANDDVHFNGPLATSISKTLSDRLTELHGALFNVILLLVWVHIVAVGFYFFVKGENLIKPMFTGKKIWVRKVWARVPSELHVRFVHPALAALLWALSAGVVWWIVR